MSDEREQIQRLIQSNMLVIAERNHARAESRKLRERIGALCDEATTFNQTVSVAGLRAALGSVPEPTRVVEPSLRDQHGPTTNGGRCVYGKEPE